MSRADRWLMLAIVALLAFAAAVILVLTIRLIDTMDRIQRLECVHYVYEDSSAVHEDAERASRCLERR